jgi:hypothetical protein
VNWCALADAAGRARRARVDGGEGAGTPANASRQHKKARTLTTP